MKEGKDLVGWAARIFDMRGRLEVVFCSLYSSQFRCIIISYNNPAVQQNRV